MIPKFKPILILEFLCQKIPTLIPILEFPNYLQKMIMMRISRILSSKFVICMNKEQKSAFKYRKMNKIHHLPESLLLAKKKFNSFFKEFFV